MTNQTALRNDINTLVQNQLLAVLSTHRDGQPYASLVAFVASDDLGSIYFVTGRSTRKFKNMMQDKRIAMLIDSRSNQQEDFHSAAAITVIGTVDELNGGDRNKIEKLYLAKHPYLEGFIKESTTALMQVHVSRYIMVTRFQEVLELNLGGKF